MHASAHHGAPPRFPQDDCKAAWLTKAQALHALGRHTEALADMQALSQTFGNDAQVSHALQRASFEVRKEKRPDYYALLKVCRRMTL